MSARAIDNILSFKVLNAGFLALVACLWMGAANAEELTMSQLNAYQFIFETPSGEVIRLSDYRGKVLLIVNTASQCGFTPQYAGLQQLHERFAAQGLVVLGVPSDDFGGQELDDDAAVDSFTKEKFSVTFQLTSISKVSGSNRHPFYAWASEKAGFLGAAKWNFHKYLIDQDGNFVASYSSFTKPTSNKVVSKIEALL
jgi:glutathione peroxidase